MDKYKVRFEKNGLLRVENGDYIVLVKNPFDYTPDNIDGFVEVEGIYYVKGYEPKCIKTKKKTKEEIE